MNRLLTKIANGVRQGAEVAEIVGLFGVLIFFLYLAGLALQPLSPIITALLALGFTAQAMSAGRWNAALVLSGLALYALAWPITHQYGPAIGMTVWFIGAMLWLEAVCRSYHRPWLTFAS